MSGGVADLAIKCRTGKKCTALCRHIDPISANTRVVISRDHPTPRDTCYISQRKCSLTLRVGSRSESMGRWDVAFSGIISLDGVCLISRSSFCNQASCQQENLSTCEANRSCCCCFEYCLPTIFRRSV